MAKVRGEVRYSQFPRDTPLREMQTWQADERARLRLLLPATKAGTLPADVETYLRRADVRAMPTFGERTQQLHEWAAIFKGRRRRSMTPDQIAAERDRWLTESRGTRADGTALPPYSPAAVNKRLRALANLWTRLDGRHAPNPVHEVAEAEEPDPQARGLPYDVIEAILAAIPETAIGVKKDGTRTTGKNIARPSKTKARLAVIAYTGIPHSTLKRLQRGDVDLDAGTVRLPPRKKGRRRIRTAKPLPVLLPLIPQAVEAFRRFDALDCWGSFSNSSMWKLFRRACRTLGLHGLTPYDFRHSYLSLVYAETRDLRVTGALGQHRSARTTERYTLAAVPPHLEAAIARVRARLATGLATSAPEITGNNRRFSPAPTGAQAPDGAENNGK